VHGACVIVVKVTVVPTVTVSVAGLNAKLPLLSVVIVTAWPLPVVVAAAIVPPVVGVGVLPDAGVGSFVWIVYIVNVTPVRIGQ
jgi:hypothetical protein